MQTYDTVAASLKVAGSAEIAELWWIHDTPPRRIDERVRRNNTAAITTEQEEFCLLFDGGMLRQFQH